MPNPDPVITEEEALARIDLKPGATKEEQQEAFYKLRAGLSSNIKMAPSKLILERYTERLRKVYEAQRFLGLKFSEQTPDGRDPMFEEKVKTPPGENNLPTLNDGLDNLPRLHNPNLSREEQEVEYQKMLEESERVNREHRKKLGFGDYSTMASREAETGRVETKPEPNNKQKENEEKYRDAVRTVVETGKGKISETLVDHLAAKQLQFDVSFDRAEEIKTEVIAKFEERRREKIKSNQNKVEESLPIGEALNFQSLTNKYKNWIWASVVFTI